MGRVPEIRVFEALYHYCFEGCVGVKKSTNHFDLEVEEIGIQKCLNHTQ